MVTPIAEQISHREECWFCACNAYSTRLANLLAEFYRLQVHKLNCHSAATISGQQSAEHETACNSLRSECAASDDRMREWHIAFAENPEEFLCVTESDLIAGQKALALKKSSQNHGAPICALPDYPGTLHCPSKEFTQLFSALLDGLIFIVQHRRPIDIESSPIQVQSLNDMILATVQLRESHPETVRNWMDRTTLLFAEFKRFSKFQRHHRMSIGPMISLELKNQLSKFLTEIKADLSLDFAEENDLTRSVHGISPEILNEARRQIKKHGKSTSTQVMLTKLKGAHGAKNLALRVLEELGEFQGFERRATADVSMQVEEIIRGLNLSRP